MKVGQIATFEEIFHYMERECGGTFTTAMTPPARVKSESLNRFWIFYAPDKNILLVALNTDWVFTHSVFKDYKGDWCHSDTDLFRVCRIMTQEEAMFELALHEDSDLLNKSHHWIKDWRKKK